MREEIFEALPIILSILSLLFGFISFVVSTLVSIWVHKKHYKLEKKVASYQEEYVEIKPTFWGPERLFQVFKKKIDNPKIIISVRNSGRVDLFLGPIFFIFPKEREKFISLLWDDMIKEKSQWDKVERIDDLMIKISPGIAISPNINFSKEDVKELKYLKEIYFQGLGQKNHYFQDEDIEFLRKVGRNLVN